MLLSLASRAIVFAAVVLMSGSASAGGSGTASPADPIAEKAKLCATCHGEQGIPINKQTPVIWGQDEGYIYLQLRDFKSGARKNALMEPIAATLEKNDMLALAAYFKKQKWPNLQQPSAPGDVAKTAETSASSIGCRGCHLQYFQGDGTTARLAGQWQEYLQADHDGLPRRVARQQSGHVGPNEGGLARRHRRVVAISRRNADRGLSRQRALRPAGEFGAERRHRGKIARRLSILVFQRPVGAACEKRFGRRRMTEHGREHQRRAPLIVLLIELRAAIEPAGL